MRYISLPLVVIAMAFYCLGQAVTFNLNSDLNLHTYTLPLPCPSSNPAQCNTSNNQALLGAGSIFAECDFSQSSAWPNPECASAGGAQVVPITATPNQNYVHIIRATDAATTPSGAAKSYFGSATGQWIDNPWEANATRFLVGVTGGSKAVFQWNPTTLQATRLYGNFQILTSGGGSNTAWFSRQPGPYAGNRTVSYFYTLQKAKDVNGLTGYATTDWLLVRYDFTSTSVTPSYTNGAIAVVADLNTAANCLPTGYYNAAGSTAMMVSFDDKDFAVGMPNSNCLATNGCTDHYDNVITYDVPRAACAIWHTDTGQACDFSGTCRNITDTASNDGVHPVQFHVNEIQGYMYGGLVEVEAAGDGDSCISTYCNHGGNTFERWVWENGIPYPSNASPVGNVTLITGHDDQGGHQNAGFLSYVNMVDYDASYGVETFWKSYYDHSTWSALTPNTIPYSSRPNCYTPGSATMDDHCPHLDTHTSWANNVDGTDTAPYFTALYSENNSDGPNSLRMPKTPRWVWADEIQALPVTCWPRCTSANHPWRIVHTLNNTDLTDPYGRAAWYNYAEITSAGGVSPYPVNNNYFVLYTTNWGGQLGCSKGTYDSSTPPGYGCPTGTGATPNRFDVFVAQVPVAQNGNHLPSGSN